MSKSGVLRILVNARLTAAAQDIIALFERTIAEYEEELCRFKEENQRKQQLLDSALSPTALQLRSASALALLPSQCGFRSPTAASVQIPSGTPPPVSDVIKEEPQEPEEPKEQRVKQEEQLQVQVPEFSGVYTKSEESSLLAQRQTEHAEETHGELISTQPQFHSETEGDTEQSSDTDNYVWRSSFNCSAEQMETDTGGDHHNQVQNRTTSTTSPNSGLPSKDKFAPKTSDTVNNGDMSGPAEISQRKKHQCTLCNKMFARNRNLQIHLRLHSGERPHSCPFCNKTFAQIGALNYHLVTHTGKIPLSCPICKKGFRISSHLKAHMTTHTGEKPYSCLLCNKSFAQKAHLTVHRRTHTGEKPYSCSLCDRAYARMDSLRSHMSQHM